jgi:hypothetical protein
MSTGRPLFQVTATNARPPNWPLSVLYLPVHLDLFGDAVAQE